MNINKVLFYIVVLFLLVKPSFGFSALIFHDGKHTDHIQVFQELLSTKDITFDVSTNISNLNLSKYSLVILEYDMYSNSNFDREEEKIKEFIKNGGYFLGVGDGGASAASKLINVTSESSLLTGSIITRILYNNSFIFNNYFVGDTFDLGSASSYHFTYTSNINQDYIAWLEINSPISQKGLLFSSKEMNIFGFTIGCGGSINIQNCKYIYSSIFDLFVNLKRVKIFSPLNKTYFTSNDSLEIPLETSIFLPNENFSFQVFVDNSLFSTKNSTEEARIKETLNLTLGSHCVKVFVNESINNEVCFSIEKVRKYSKPLFIVDKDWKNILALSPLKVPVIVHDEKYKDEIDFFVENYKPDKIFVLGNISYRGSKIELKDLKLFFNSSKGIYADSFEKYLIASQIASLLEMPIVFSKDEAIYDFSLNSSQEIEDFYLKLAKEKNLTLNYVILTNKTFSSIISSLKQGFIIFVNSSNSTEVKEVLKEKAKKLNSLGFLFNNSLNILKGNYLLLFGIPSFEAEDPLDDEEDGNIILTDVFYADLDNDNYLDFSFGRLPEEESLASLIFSRGFLDANKKALVASEYLHQNFLSVLLYGGGGMLYGRNVAEALEKKGYEVVRLVEHRTNHKAFLNELKPKEIAKFIVTYEGIRKILEKYVSSSLSTFLANALIITKGSEMASEALMSYFEYDWKNFYQNYEDVLYYLAEKEAKNESLSLNDIVNIINLLWPNAWEELNENNLKKYLPEVSVVFYEGLGNGSLWILPNNFVQSNDILSYEFWKEQFTNYQYNGSKVFKPEDVPKIKARIVWDDSDFSAVGELKDEFLKKGAASFIGSSAISYSPFSAELSSRFFSNENTIGKAFSYAYNSFLSDSFTWDPLNFKKGNTKAKTLLEFFVIGDPSLPKEEKFEVKELMQRIECKEKCKLNVLLSDQVIYSNNTIEMNSSENLIEEDGSIIPLKRFVYYLPENSSIDESKINVTFEEEKIENFSLPKVEIISHSNKTLKSNESLNISKKQKIRIRDTLDGRKEVEVIVPSLFYNETENSTTIIKNVSISLEYETPLDFSLEANNVKLGENVSLKFKIFSKIKDKAKIHLEISNSSQTFNFTYDFDLENKSMEINFQFKPEAPGKYKVKAVLEKLDPMFIGPREAYFEVYDNENETFCIPKVRINEIMYNPKGSDTGREWIEIFNYGSCNVNLTNWYISDKNGNHKLTLKFGSEILKAKDYAIISNNATKFLEEHLGFSKTIFQASFSLVNTNDTIAIKNSSKEVIDEVFYSKDMGAYDNGKSLELDESLGWRESYVDEGTPGEENSKPIQVQSSNNQEIVASFESSPKENLQNVSQSLNQTIQKNESLKNETVSNTTSEKQTNYTRNKTVESKSTKVPTSFFVLSKNVLPLAILSASIPIGYLLIKKFQIGLKKKSIKRAKITKREKIKARKII